MSIWLSIGLIAYFLTAVAFLIDKYLLVGPARQPLAYAFWVAVFSAAVVIVIPFGVYLPGTLYLTIAFVSGTTFFFGLVFLYRAIRKTDVSVASTKVSVISVTFAYIFSVFLLGESFQLMDIATFGVVIAGIFLLGKTGRSIWSEAFLGGILFGFSLVTLKLTFDLSDFVNGFFWTRVGFFGAALAMLVSPSARREIFKSYRGSPLFSKFLFLVSKGVAGIGFLLIDIAVNLGNVALVNALLGAQFFFIFVLALIFGKKIPEIAENNDFDVLVRKFSGAVLVVLGIILLFK